MSKDCSKAYVSHEDVVLFRRTIRALPFTGTYPSLADAELVGLQNKYNCSKQENMEVELLEKMNERLADVLCSRTGYSAREYFRLMKHHYGFLILVEGRKFWLFYNVADALFSAMGNEARMDRLTEEKLSFALEVLVEKGRVSSASAIRESGGSCEARVFSVGRAVGRLHERLKIGYRIENGDVIVERSDLSFAGTDLVEKIKRIGGIAFLRTMFKYLRSTSRWNPEHRMYFFSMSTSGMGYKQEPSEPWGYLFNIAISQVTENISNSVATDSQIAECIAEAKDIAAVVDVEPFNVWETQTNEGMDVLRVMREMIQFDLIFKIPQIKPANTLFLLRGLFKWTEGFSSKTTIVGYREINVFISKILELILNKPEPMVLELGRLKAMCGRALNGMQFKLLCKIFFHAEAPNGKFYSPVDAEKETLTAHLKPGIMVTGETVVFPVVSFCAYGIIEATMAYFRDRIANFDGELGRRGIEDTVKDVLGRRNIPFKSGEYKNVDGEKAEVDFAIETEKRILLIEAKKKPLKQSSKCGDVDSILIDVQKSLIASQLQAYRHERNLRRDGKIDFGNSILELNGRDIDKISLVMFDYGSIQHRTVVQQMAEFYLNNDFVSDSSDEKWQLELKGMNAKRKRLAELYTETFEYLPENTKHLPFFGLWFLCLNQLLIFTEGVKSTEDFVEQMRTIGHVNLGTLDILWEFTKRHDIKQNLVPPYPMFVHSC